MNYHHITNIELSYDFDPFFRFFEQYGAFYMVLLPSFQHVIGTGSGIFFFPHLYAVLQFSKVRKILDEQSRMIKKPQYTIELRTVLQNGFYFLSVSAEF